MNKPGYFDREVKLRTMEDVNRVLSARTGHVIDGGGENVRASLPSVAPTAAPTPVLRWLDPVKHPSGSGSQLSECGRYIIRKCQDEQNVFRFYLWFGPADPRKLIAHRATVQEVQTFAQEHAERRSGGSGKS